MARSTHRQPGCGRGRRDSRDVGAVSTPVGEGVGFELVVACVGEAGLRRASADAFLGARRAAARAARRQQRQRPRRAAGAAAAGRRGGGGGAGPVIQLGRARRHGRRQVRPRTSTAAVCFSRARTHTNGRRWECFSCERARSQQQAPPQQQGRSPGMLHLQGKSFPLVNTTLMMIKLLDE